jgi:Na+-translocating ferredoxin:NAD+ oxidoreductase RNF subunit RnfB
MIQLSQILTPVLIAGTLALILGVIIVVVSRIFAVPVDQRLEDLKAILPGANCGACGFSGCEGYAESLAGGDTNTARCPVGGAEVARELSNYLGVAVPSFLPKVAQVHCQGTQDHTSRRYEYRGIISCAAAHSLFSGPNSCTYGCLGYGDCAAACPYGAIYLAQGIAQVNAAKCTACGLCVRTCPKQLIAIIPKHLSAYTVKCRNKWPGAQTRKNCTVGCIGCQRCFRACSYEAISMEGPLAVIDQDKCAHCGDCEAVCPTHSIVQGLTLGPDSQGRPQNTASVKSETIA